MMRLAHSPGLLATVPQALFAPAAETNEMRQTAPEYQPPGSHSPFASSNICETTTPGVKQYSGYIEVGKNVSMFFWLFEARHNPHNAPLVAWMNSGPGCPSMIGAFQEHGPCKFSNNETEPSNNPYSWNEAANMLYIDQPINTGFSYGSPNFNSIFNAAPYIYTFLQTFISAFPEYKSRELGLFGESYGGHWIYYAEYIASQNDLIAAGKSKAQPLNLATVGLNNAWYDPILQMNAQVDYSYSNGHLQTISASQRSYCTQQYDQYCKPAEEKCTVQYGNDQAYIDASNACYDYVEEPLFSQKTLDVYDVRETVAVNPPETYVGYLSRKDIQKHIGARVDYTECVAGDQNPGYRLGLTGDGARTFLLYLEKVVNRGIPTLIWAGDTDWICDWMGSFAVVSVFQFPGYQQFRSARLQPYTINGKAKGQYKKQGSLAFMRVYEAGHEIAVYQPQAALHVFSQFLNTKTVQSD